MSSAGRPCASATPVIRHDTRWIPARPPPSLPPTGRLRAASRRRSRIRRATHLDGRRRKRRILRCAVPTISAARPCRLRAGPRRHRAVIAQLTMRDRAAAPADQKRWIIARFAETCQKCPQKQRAKSAPPPRRRRGALVLASTSRYRQMLLDASAFPLSSSRPGIDEAPLAGRGTGGDGVAARRSQGAQRRRARIPDALIIGSDQVADCDGAPIGKPGTHDRAVAQLAELSGRTVVFHTGLRAARCARPANARRALVDVRSTFRELTRGEIEAYLRRERPYDCAGGVRSEALGIALFESIESDDPTALIGLPLIASDDDAARRRRWLPAVIAPMSADARGALYVVPNLLGAITSHRCAARAHDRPPRAPMRSLGRRDAEARARVPEVARPARCRSPRSISARFPSAIPRAADLDDLLAPARARRRRRAAVGCRLPGHRRSRGRAGRRGASPRGFAVVPLVGPSSVLLALMASGHERPGIRVSRLSAGEQSAARTAAHAAARSGVASASAHAQMFIETPYRNVAMLAGARRRAAARARGSAWPSI